MIDATPKDKHCARPNDKSSSSLHTWQGPSERVGRGQFDETQRRLQYLILLHRVSDSVPEELQATLSQHEGHEVWEVAQQAA